MQDCESEAEQSVYHLFIVRGELWKEDTGEEGQAGKFPAMR